ncbi:vomeronasal type-2 receptor 1 isoform X1 [Erpetoichthys calabaricus]|uniref:vomeronasal type-2 receptor 1 isoform X1 n=1 Tax=Erpetoichthys calabaricus TaxID=27687 RepID=UPI002234DC2D|nr:vomeronasal type-2 receptor 1 isoform X1 [Erpetoichthys calabaricus]
MELTTAGMKARLLVGLLAVSPLLTVVSAQQTCKLKAKFNLNGFKNKDNKDIVLGGMFPVHNRLASSNDSTSSMPTSSDCEGFNFRAFRWAQTMRFVIDEINIRKDLLPNITLGYVIYDSCFTISKSVEGTLTYLTGQDEAVPNYRCGSGAPLAALVGAGGSALSIATARILGLYYFPQVSYCSSCSVLSDTFQFPSFLRTIPNDNYQSKAMAQLVVNFGWTWVGTIAADDDYGKYGIKLFKEEVEKAGVCISFSETLPKLYSQTTIQRIVDTIKKSTANIIVVFSSDVDFSPLMEELVNHNITNKTWIASEAWVTSALISMQEYYPILRGTIGFAIKRAVISGLFEFLNKIDPYATSDPLMREFWQRAYNCTLDDEYMRLRMETPIYSSNITESRIHTLNAIGQRICTGKETPESINNTYYDVSQLRITYSVYKAVYTVAYALHYMATCKEGKGPFVGNTCANISNFEPWQLMYYLKNLKFTALDNEAVFFNANGDVDAYYDILNWQINKDGKIRYVKIGYYNGTAPTGQEMSITNNSVMWNTNNFTQPPRSVCSESCLPGTRKGIRQGEPVCCFDCIPCADGEITNETDARECIQCGTDYWSNAKKDACVPKEIEFLAYDEALGITLIAVSVFGACVAFAVVIIYIIYRNTPLVKANDIVLTFFIQFSLIITFLSSITFVGQPQPWSCMTRHVSLALGFAICLSCIMGKTIVLMFSARAAKSKTPEKVNSEPIKPIHQKIIALVGSLIQVCGCTIWLILYPPYPVKNTASQNIKIILECSEGNIVFICCIFGYDVLLALLGFVFAFIARKLPDNFNEGKFVTFGMLVFFIVWSSFVPAYLSTRGKFMVAVHIFAILASSFGLLACIFVPKCYIIVLKPERNTDELVKSQPKLIDKSAPGTSTSLSSEINSTTVSTVSMTD